MIRFFLLIVALTCSCSFSFSQKVKYKDLILLLNAKQYDVAEPVLKRYLKDNNDNPNAHLFMGYIYEEKALHLDPLLETNKLVQACDSANYFFALAAKGIDERELKKNDEYYESFARRDIRTGKFGVKVSDIQLDLEKKTKAMKDRADRVKLLKKQFQASESAYQRSSAMYKKLSANYANERELLLLADESLMSDLKRIGETYDSSLLSFNGYKSTSQLLGKTGHNQTITAKEIKDFKKDGQQDVDFLSDNLELWDYKSWSAKAAETIIKDITPLRGRLVAYDIEINKLRDRQLADSISVKVEIGQLSERLSADPLKKYDTDPMPMTLFMMKLSEQEYISDLIIHKKCKDSSDVRSRLTCVKSEITAIKKVDSLARKLLSRGFESDAKIYNDFITKAYGTTSVLNSHVKATLDYAEREKLKRDREWERFSQSLKWLVSGKDSIPLFVEIGKEYRFKPLVIVAENHTAGITYADSLGTGYFYTITPSRIPDVKASFPINQSNFKRKEFNLLKGLSFNDPNNQIFFVLFYSAAKFEDKFPATLAKFYRTDGLAWSVNISLEMIPSELLYSPEPGELSVKMTNPSGESKLVRVDKNGKLLQ